MAKILTGTVVSKSMEKTIVVEITRKTPHPLYRKLQKRSKRFKVAIAPEQEVVIGETVQISETKPVAKGKHFTLVTKEGKEKTKKEDVAK